MAQILIDESAAPSTPATGKATLYVKTDGLFYGKDDAGTETVLGGGPASADYLVKTANSGLSAERVVSDNTDITFDWAVAGVVKALLGAFTGDITKTAGSLTTTIANDAVTYAKMQNIATDSLIGRDTTATGDPETIGLNATLSMDGAGNLQRAALTGDVTASAGSNTTAIADNAIANTDIRDSGALSVIGRSANSSGDPADISAVAASAAVLRESGSVLGFGTIATAGITDAAVTLAKMANLAQSTIIGRAAGAGTGVPTALTVAQVMSVLGIFTGLNNIEVVLKSATETVTSSTTLQDDDHITWSIAANKKAYFIGILFIFGSALGDIKLGFKGSAAGADGSYAVFGPQIATTDVNATLIACSSKGLSTTTDPASIGCDGTNQFPVIVMGYATTGANAQTMVMQWAQNTSNGTGTEVRAGGFVVVLKET